MLKDLLLISNKFVEYIEHENMRGTKYINLLKKFKEEFDDASKEVHLKITDIPAFIEKHMTKLFKIHEASVGTYAKLYLDKASIRDLRSSYDKFFGKVLGLKRFPSKIKYMPTTITTEFCKGITSFEDQYEKNAHPFYHREESCGSKGLPAQQKFSSEQTKRAVRLCYLERFIYDKVYLNVMHEQDLVHLKELKMMERFYQNYFPGYRLNIEMAYNQHDDCWPIKVQIITTDNNHKMFFETYRKTYDFMKDEYKNEVFADKNDVFAHKTYTKTQTYEGETSWILDI